MDFPDDLIVEILSWLPPETLVTLRTVCKSWFSIISDPKFVQLHRSRATGRIVIPMVTRGSYFYPHRPDYLKFSVYEDNDIVGTAPEHLKLLDNRMASQFWEILGTCYGVICYTSIWFNCNLTVLCNPCFGSKTKNHLLPPRPIDPRVNSMYSTNKFTYGVGHDGIDDDYRVVKMRSGFGLHDREAAVFSLMSNSWKRIEPPVLDLNTSGASIFLNGFIHWLNLPPDSSLTLEGIASILVFDVTKEDFGKMQLPKMLDKYWRYDGYHATTISTMKGSLCVTTVVKGRFLECEVWRMNEYGVTESWTKVYKYKDTPLAFRTVDVTVGGKMLMFCGNGWVARDGNLVFERDEKVAADINATYDGNLVLYDLTTQKYSNMCRTLTSIRYASIAATF